MLLVASLLLAALAPADAEMRPSRTVPFIPGSNSIDEETDGFEPPVSTNCTIPRPSRDETIIVLNFNEGAAVPDYSIVGRDGETTSGAIEIGDGPGKIYLVLSSNYPMIFRVSGRTDRLTRVVALNNQAAGIAGVDPRKVSFGIGVNCTGGSYGAGEFSTGTARSLFGRRPDAAGNDERLYHWVIGAHGAGTPISAPNYFYDAIGTRLEQAMDQRYAGGVVKIDPKRLVASSTAEPYYVLPASAGAVQLERAGWIVRATDNEIADWRARARARYGPVDDLVPTNDFYRVTRPIVLPAHLCSPLITFLVPSTSSVVTGSPSCHSNVVETNGRILHLAGHFLPEELKDRP